MTEDNAPLLFRPIPPFFMCKFFHQFHLDLLDLHQPLPLIQKKMVHLLVQVADLQFSLEVDAIIMLRLNSGVSAFPAAYCGVSERIRLCSYLENRDSLQLAAGSFNAVPRLLAVLAHENDRGLHGGKTGKDQVEKDIRVGIKGFDEHDNGIHELVQRGVPPKV